MSRTRLAVLLLSLSPSPLLQAQEPTPPPHGVATATPAEDLEELATVRVIFEHEDGLFVCDGNGQDVRRFNQPGENIPATIGLSADGATYAYVLHDALRLGTPDRSATIVAPIPGWGAPVWAPDGSHLAIGTDERTVGTGALWLVAIDRDAHRAAEPQRLTAEGAFAAYPAFSPDGRWLAFATERSQEIVEGHDTIHVERRSQVELRELGDDAGSAPRVVSPRTGEIHAITWSPDGRWLAFECDSELCLVSMAGGEPGPTRVLCGELPRGQPLRWRPDSGAILLTRTVARRAHGKNARPAEDALVLVPLDGELTVVPLGTTVYDVAWTPDGRFALFTAGDRGLYRLRLEGHRIERLHDDVEHWAQLWVR
ncbi:MAG: hypothetical protein AB7O97_20945 [Planctomycetota bacterium]